MSGEATGRVIALDVGGTAMKGALLAADGGVEAYHRWRTPREEGPDAVVAAVFAAVDELLERSVRPEAFGLVVPGLVDDRAGIALFSENILWRDVPFRRLVAERTGLPVGFGHDVRAGGLAERVMGAARGAEDVLFMPIGTGISAAMQIEGRSVDNMFAGEIGHVDVGSGERCACGAIGCLETVATGPSIARRYNELTGMAVAGAKPVAERAAAGDAVAATVWQGAVEGLAHALASYVSLLAPELVVIGGGLSAAGEFLLAPLRTELARRLVWQRMPRIVPAALGENAACLGAGLLASNARKSVLSTASGCAGVHTPVHVPPSQTRYPTPSQIKESHLSSTATTDRSFSPGSEATEREIAQQPDLWREVARNIEARRGELDAFLAPLLARADLRIVLTGAGTSAFVGSVAAPALSRLLDRRVDAVATTDIVSNPRLYFAEDIPTLLVSFARSGNSPESVATTQLADEVLSEVSHLVLTCDATGTLAVDHADRANSTVVLMPARANDEGFAMTSSFTSMLLSSLLILAPGDAADVETLAEAAARVLEEPQAIIRELPDGEFDRVVYLGSGPLAGLAQESALKLLELTAGEVVSFHDSSLGFRHGPKSVLTDKTLAIVYVSSDPLARQYDLDIVDELGRSIRPGNLVVVASASVPVRSGDHLFVLEDLDGIDDAFLAIVFVLVAQLLGVSFSLRLGLTPDNPFPEGNVNRVVKGVRIHSLDGGPVRSA